MSHVLIVEDDDLLAQRLQKQLLDAGFLADRVNDAEQALMWPDPAMLDAIILDLGLPGMDGDEFIRTWRSKGWQTPILVLSARSNWEEKVNCLDSGAEDYVVKPVRLEELVARLRSLGRRTALRADEKALVAGPIRIEPGLKRVKLNGEEILLSAMEYRLLLLFVRRKGGAITQDEAIDALYPLEAERQRNTIEAHIARLRRKIGRDRIINVRGLGYKLAL